MIFTWRMSIIRLGKYDIGFRWTRQKVFFLHSSWKQYSVIPLTNSVGYLSLCPGVLSTKCYQIILLSLSQCLEHIIKTTLPWLFGWEIIFFHIFITISKKFVSKAQVHNKTGLKHVKARWQTFVWPLIKPKLIQFTDVNMPHNSSLG